MQHHPVKIGKGRYKVILAEQPKDGKWTVKRRYEMQQSGNYGWTEDFYCNGKPVVRAAIDNCRSFGAVWDIRDSLAPLPTPETEPATV